MTWNPSSKEKGWAYKELKKYVIQPYTKKGIVEVNWRTISTKKTKLGDQVFLYQQGKGKTPTGVFGRGKVIGPPIVDVDGKNKVKIQINDFIDPRAGFFVNEEKSFDVLGKMVSTQASGISISNNLALELNKIIDKKIAIKESENDSFIKWTKEEITICLEAYLKMMLKEKSGKPYTKSKINEFLRNNQLKNRSRGSIEYRMQNISYILKSMGQPYIKGYAPLKNTGPVVASFITSYLIKHSLLENDLADISQVNDEFRKKVSRTEVKEDPPEGNENPQKIIGIQSGFSRCPKIVSWVLKQAKGRCDNCDNLAPFKDSKGKPFLEVHHVQWLSKGGKDSAENAVALCPNCHRAFHYSKDKKLLGDNIIKKIARLKKVADHKEN